MHVLFLILMLWHRHAIFESIGDKLSSFEAGKSETPNRRQTECPLTNRPRYRGSSKNFNSTADPYDEWAFSQPDFTAGIGSPLAHLLFDFDSALAQGSDFESKGDKSCLTLLNAGFEPWKSETPNRQQTVTTYTCSIGIWFQCVPWSHPFRYGVT